MLSRDRIAGLGQREDDLIVLGDGGAGVVGEVKLEGAREGLWI
jgi:hypothetical protein